MKLHLSIPLVAVSLFAAAPAGAVVEGGSNFGAFNYPSHGCGVAPTPPPRPADMTSVREVEAYNRLVDDYNIRVRSYSECIGAYVERAEKDMERIREKADQAIEDMRRAGPQQSRAPAGR